MTAEKAEIYGGISEKRLHELLDRLGKTAIGFVGDLCVDIYWIADMTKSELSRETAHFPLPVTEERFQPGAGGNVLSNLAALGPKAVRAAGVMGDDWRGAILAKCLDERGVTREEITVVPGAVTNAYCKPIRRGYGGVSSEDPRLDFTSAPPDDKTQRNLARAVKHLAESVDAICVSDQFVAGCVTPCVREAIMRAAAGGTPVIVDSRDRAAQFRGVTLKPNELECVRAASSLGFAPDPGEELPLGAALALARSLDCDVCVTLGPKGSLQIFGGRAVLIPPRPVEGPLDFCGAGDTFLAAYTAAVAAGADHAEAGQIGALASEVTIRKIAQTGTATREEIVERYNKAYRNK